MQFPGRPTGVSADRRRRMTPAIMPVQANLATWLLDADWLAPRHWQVLRYCDFVR